MKSRDLKIASQKMASETAIIPLILLSGYSYHLSLFPGVTNLMTTSTIVKTLAIASTGAVCMILGSALSAHALTLTFDDLSGNLTSIPNGYGGFNWNNFYNVNPAIYAPNSGYKNGIVSNKNVAYNSFENPASIFTNGTPFTFNSVYLTGAWNNRLNILIQGFQGANQLYSQTVTVNSTAPTLFNFNWSGIDRLRFNSFGGVNAGYNGSGTHFALDNLTVNATPVPTPALLPGLIGLGLGVLRKRKAEAAEQASEA